VEGLSLRTIRVRPIAERTDLGDAAELGVWKGNTAAIHAAFTRRVGTNAYLLDSFEGFKDDGLTGIDADKAMEFADISWKVLHIWLEVRLFPAYQDQIPTDARFAFVHIDCDLYKAHSRRGLNSFIHVLLRVASS